MGIVRLIQCVGCCFLNVVALSGGLVIRRSLRQRAPNLGWALLVLPFLLILMVGLLRLISGPGYGLLPLLAVGPASAAAVGGRLFTLCVGGTAAVQNGLMAFDADADHPAKAIVVSFGAIAGVTVFAVLTSHIRLRRERELAEVRAVADVTQRVVLRPVPDRVGPLRLAARYLSASAQARVGGDLYAVVPTAQGGVRLIIGDAEGKGLVAVQEAATVMGAFRAAAYQEYTLAATAASIEVILDRELGDEQFITAVLAQVSPDGTKMEVINCGHPRPLQLGPRGPRFLGPEDGNTPLGLSLSAVTERHSFTVPLRPGEPVLFYTDGLSEARNGAGEFFPLTEAASMRVPADPSSLLGRLSAEVSRYVGHRPHDDMALLLVERTACRGTPPRC
jgi:serine phosphatase RsbU (regulator of sigma subunit)